MAVIALAIAVWAFPALAQEETANTAAADEMATIQKRVYIYEVRGRRDPFVSLITPPKSQKELTGNPLLDNDISQMRVIAIVSDAEQSYALFGLPDGKYYTITPGMEIGLHDGVVEDIQADSVLIREIKPNFKGEPTPVDTYLRLRKEEGQ